MTGCSALGLLPVACASVGWQRAREAGVERPVLVSGQGRGGLTGAAWLLSDKLLAASRHWCLVQRRLVLRRVGSNPQRAQQRGNS